MPVFLLRRWSMHQIEHLLDGSGNANGRKAMENPQGHEAPTVIETLTVSNIPHAVHIARPRKLRPSHTPNLELRQVRDHQHLCDIRSLGSRRSARRTLETAIRGLQNSAECRTLLHTLASLVPNNVFHVFPVERSKCDWRLYVADLCDYIPFHQLLLSVRYGRLPSGRHISESAAAARTVRTQYRIGSIGFDPISVGVVRRRSLNG